MNLEQRLRLKQLPKKEPAQRPKRATKKQSAERFFGGTAAIINGEETVKLNDKGGRITGTLKDGTEIIFDTPSAKVDDISIDDNGNLSTVTMSDSQGNTYTFSGETAMDLAIKDRQNKIGSVPSDVFNAALEQETKKVEVEYIKESKPKSEQKTEKVNTKVDKPTPVATKKKQVTKKNDSDKAKEASVKEKKVKQAAKDIASTLRKAKFAQSVNDLSNLQSSGIFQAAWDGTIELVATTIEAGGTIAQAVNDGVAYIKETDWYKGLSEEGKKKAVSKTRRTLRTELKATASPEKLAHDITTEKEAREELVQYAGRKMTENKVGGLTRGKVKTFMRAIRDVNKKNFVELAEKIDSIIDKDAANREESQYYKKRNRAIKNAKNFGKWGSIFRDFAMIDQGIIPTELIDEYNDLLDKISAVGAKLDSMKEDVDLALKIIDAANKQYENISEEQEDDVSGGGKKRDGR